MLTKDDLSEIKKLLKPIREDVEITKNKTSKIDARQGLMVMEVHRLSDKIDVLDEKIEEGFKHTLDFAHEIEKERGKDEKRVTRLEEKLGLSSTT